MSKFIKLAVALITCAIMLITFCSCTFLQIIDAWQPVRASSEVEHYAERAIEIIDSYLHFKINAQETEDAFAELYDRINLLDIIWSDETYNMADQAINSALSHIHPFSADRFNDTVLYMYRDVFAYQIGKDVSDSVYTPEKRNYIAEENKKAVETLGFFDAPFASIFALSSDDYITLHIEFDKMNGITAEDMESQVKNLYNIITSEDSVIDSALVTFSVYQQEAFIVSLYPSGPYYSLSKLVPGDLETIVSGDNISVIIDAMMDFLISME